MGFLDGIAGNASRVDPALGSEVRAAAPADTGFADLLGGGR